MSIQNKTTNYLLSVRDLTITHHNKKIVSDINFTVNTGELVAIIGANGAGKSTLLNHIVDDAVATGSKYQCHGELVFLDEPINAIVPEQRAQQLALLAQASRLQFPFTVEEVVALGRTPHSTGNDCDQRIVQTLLSHLDIAHLSQHIYTHLSGGEKQRVQLARVLAQLAVAPNKPNVPPRLLLLDEPCNALDMQHQQQLLVIIQQLKLENIAVLLVSHDLNWVTQCADRFLALKQGELIAQGDAQTVITAECLRDIYDIEASVIPHPTTQRPVVLV